MPTNAELTIILRMRDLAAKKVKAVRTQLRLFGARARTAFRNAGEAARKFRFVLLAVAAALGALVKTGADFELQLTKIATLLKETNAVTNDFAPAIRTLSLALGQSLDALTAAQFDIISAGITDTTQAIEVLTASAKLATAGFTDTATAASATLTLIQNFPDAFKNAADATDFLIVTQQKARVTVGQLASNFGKLLGIAADAEVNIEQLGAAFVLVKNTGLSSEETMTSLRALIIAMSKEFGSAATQGEKFGDTIQRLSEMTKDQRLEVLKNVEALKALGPITASMNDFRRLSIELGQREGAVNVELAKVLDTLSIKFAKVREAVKFLGVAFSAFGADAMKSALDDLQKAILSLAPAFGVLGTAVAVLSQPISLLIRLIAFLVNSAVVGMQVILNAVAAMVGKALGLLSKLSGFFNQGLKDSLQAASEAVNLFAENVAMDFVKFQDQIANTETMADSLTDAINNMPDAINAMRQAMEVAGEAGTETMGALQQAGEATVQALTNDFSNFFFDTFTKGAQSAGEVFANFGKSILRILLDMIAKALVLKVILTTLGFVFPAIKPAIAGIQKAGGFTPSFKKGGPVRSYADGGEVLANLHEGEFVVNKQATNRNKGLLQRINSGEDAGGGSVVNQFFITATDEASFRAKIQESADVIEGIFQSSMRRNSGGMRTAVRLA